MWRFKKKEKKTESVRLSQIYIYTRGKLNPIALEVSIAEGSVLTPWIEFYKWYYLRESASYTIKFKNGMYILNRLDIEVIEIKESFRSIKEQQQ